MVYVYAVIVGNELRGRMSGADVTNSCYYIWHVRGSIDGRETT